MTNPKVWLIYIYGLRLILFPMFIKCLGAKFKFGFLMLSKDCKNSYKIDKVLGLIDLDVTSSLKEKEIKIGLDLSRGSVSGGQGVKLTTRFLRQAQLYP